MAAYAVLVLSLAILGFSRADLDFQVCWRDSYCRGHGSFPDVCTNGTDLEFGLCYQKCEANYTGVGNTCWENCPPGWLDLGGICNIPPSIYFPCPWYDICGVTVAKGCRDNCSEGYHSEACTCKKPGKTMTKKSYNRGSGKIPECKPELEQSFGFCYPPCNHTFVGFGPICYQNESSNATYGVDCNALAFGHSQADCDDLNKTLKQAGITTKECVGWLALSIITGQPQGPKKCRDLIEKVFPKLASEPVC